MKLDPKEVASKVIAKLAADDPDLDYYTFKNDTIMQTSGRDYSLKEWIRLHLDDFTEDIIHIPLRDDDRELLFEEIGDEISNLLAEHIKRFFKENKNKVDEDEWDAEVKSLKKQIEKHYIRVSSYIERMAKEYIRELTNELKLI